MYVWIKLFVFLVAKGTQGVIKRQTAHL